MCTVPCNPVPIMPTIMSDPEWCNPHPISIDEEQLFRVGHRDLQRSIVCLHCFIPHTWPKLVPAPPPPFAQAPPLRKHHYPLKLSFLEPSIDGANWVFSLFCAVLCQFCCKNVYLFAEEPSPLCVLQSQMSSLPRGYPLKYRRSTGDMANGVLANPSPFGDSFVSITCDRHGVVHQCSLQRFCCPSSCPQTCP